MVLAAPWEPSWQSSVAFHVGLSRGWLSFFIIWPLAWKRKCSEREVKTTSLLRSGPGSRHRITSAIFYCSVSQGAHPDSRRGYRVFISRWKEGQVFVVIFNVIQWIRKPIALTDAASFLAIKRGTSLKINLAQWTSELKIERSWFLESREPLTQPILETSSCLGFHFCKISYSYLRWI